jgi:hypothetical protein
MLNPIHCNEENRMYPICVNFVVEEIDDVNDPVLRKIEELCLHLNIEFHLREFEPTKYIEDRHYITRLPAIQIYERGLCVQTVFTDEKPFLAIRQIHDKFEMEYLNRLAKKQIWDEKLKYLKRIFFRKVSLKTDSVEPRTRL